MMVCIGERFDSMYFGSVKFFKRLILAVVFGWIAVSTFFAVFFGIKYNIEKEKAGGDAVEVSSDSASLNVPDGTSLEDIYLAMSAKGYSSEDILDFLLQNDEMAVDKFVEEYMNGDQDPGAKTGSAETEISAETENAETEAVSETEKVAETEAEDADAPSYTKLYPDLYAEYPKEFGEDTKTVYLTFDDGPSDNTLMILSILKKHNIKATFFMSGSTTEKGKAIMKQVADEGHAIGVHSYSHDYEKIYESVDSYLDDFYNTYSIIYDATGVKPEIFRFAGGSYNDFNHDIYDDLVAEMTRRGFVYYDWNVSAQDAVVDPTWTYIYNNVLNGVKGNSTNRQIVLMHDSADKYATVTTVEDIIIELEKDGYSFDKLDNTVPPTHIVKY